MQMYSCFLKQFQPNKGEVHPLLRLPVSTWPSTWSVSASASSSSPSSCNIVGFVNINSSVKVSINNKEILANTEPHLLSSQMSAPGYELIQCWCNVDNGQIGHTRITFHLTLNVQGPSKLGLTRSISWLLMPWLLASPGHRQPWYWLCRIGRSLSYSRRNFNYLSLICVEEWHKM